jgi:hypothetical protein
MNTLDFSNVISHVKRGETPDNESQAIIKYIRPDYDPSNELRDFFYCNLYFGGNYNRSSIFSFLDYHMSKFKGDKIDFFDFIKREIQPERINALSVYKYHETNIRPVNDIINEWIHKKTIKSIKVKDNIDTLERACNGPKEYNLIKRWFIDQELCHANTFIWTGNEKVKGKTALVNYIKDLHIKGYAKELSHRGIKTIAKNDFGTDISIPTIKKAKGNPGYPIPELPYFKS